MHVETKKKAIEAVAKIKEASQNEKVEYELLNLSSLKSIKQCAETIKAKHKRIDILINNAGNHYVNLYLFLSFMKQSLFFKFTIVFSNIYPHTG